MKFTILPAPLRAKLTTLPARLKGTFDIQDLLLAAGFWSLPYGAGMIYRPAGMLVLGAQCYVFAFFIERVRTYAEKQQPKGGKN